MADNAELHGKILGFLMGEWSRKDNRQLVGVDLLYSPGGGFRDEEIRRWDRADEPEFFAEFVNIEKLVIQIIEIAEGEADAKAPGKHRFIVRTRQHMGSKPLMSFVLSPGYIGGSDEAALVPHGSGGGGGSGGGSRGGDVAVAQILAANNGQLMRTNQQMFDGTIRVLGQQTMSLHEQVASLTAENATLRRELEEARSNKNDREFQIAMATEKNARTNAALQKALQLGTVFVSKLTAGGEGAQAGDSRVMMLLDELYRSIRPDQMGTLMQLFDMPQKILFMEIGNLVIPSEPKADGPGPRAHGAPNGAA